MHPASPNPAMYNCERSCAAFRVAPQRCRREIWFTSLLWTQFCLKMVASIGDCHLQLKEQFWLAESVFQNGGIPREMSFAIKRTILISLIDSQLGELLPPIWSARHLRGRPWTQIGMKTVTESESTQRYTLNAAHTSFYSKASMLTITLHRLPGAITLPTITQQCGSLLERLVPINTTKRNSIRNQQSMQPACTELRR